MNCRDSLFSQRKTYQLTHALIIGLLLKRWCLPILVAMLSFNGFAQQQKLSPKEEKAAEVRDSILTQLYNLLAAGDYTKAHNEAVKTLNACKGDIRTEAPVYFLLGEIDLTTGNKKGALAYYRKGRAIMQHQGGAAYQSSMPVVFQKFANYYFESSIYDSARYYAQLSIDSSKAYRPEINDLMLSRNLPIIGYSYFLKRDYARATATYNKVIDLNKQLGDEAESANIYIKIADVKAAQSDYAGAVAMCEKAFRLGIDYKIPQYRLSAVNKLIDIHKQFGNYREVAAKLQLKMDLMDEINLADQKKQLEALEAKFQSTLRNQENKSLKAINKKQQTQNRFLSVIVVLAAVAGLSVLVFAVVFFRQKRRIARQKANVDRLNMLNQKIFSVISHDFKGPMMGLDMLLGMQEQQEGTSERFTRQTTQLRNDLKQANLILENLLNWSKTELGITGHHLQFCDGTQVVKAVTEQLESLITQKQLTVSTDLPETLSIPVPADMLTIILRNLLSNAIKYSNEKGRILIAYDGATAEFFVRDHGMGMDRQRLEQLFVQQVDSRLGTRHESGYGIGLHFVYELIGKHNGTIRAESEPGTGTTVYFHFTPITYAS